MAENVTLQGHDLEMSRSSQKVNNILYCNLHPTPECTCEVLLRSYQQFLWKSGAKFD